MATLPHLLAPGADPVLERLRADVESGRLPLPSLPGVAQRVIEILNQPSCTTQRVADVIATDPAIAAKLLRAANSAVYRGHTPCDSVNGAVVRLGTNAVQHLVTSISLLSVFASKDPEASRRMARVWSHSVRVAATARVLVQRLRRDGRAEADPDQALLGGLLHDVGAVPLIDLSARDKEALGPPATVDAEIERLKGPVGALLLERWNFPAALVGVARDAEVWRRPRENPLDLCDLVQVAQLCAGHGGPGAAHLPGFGASTAFRKLAARGLRPQDCLRILEESRAAIRELERMLAT